MFFMKNKFNNRRENNNSVVVNEASGIDAGVIVKIISDKMDKFNDNLTEIISMIHNHEYRITNLEKKKGGRAK